MDAPTITNLEQARTEISRLRGFESQFNTLAGQIPGGDITAHLTEFARRGTEEGRLLAEVGTLTTRAAAAEGEVTRLTSELETARAAKPEQEQIEMRAAEIHAGTGVPPAAAETAPVAASASDPQNSEAFYAEYTRLHAENPVKAAAYWQQWSGKY